MLGRFPSPRHNKRRPHFPRKNFITLTRVLSLAAPTLPAERLPVVGSFELDASVVDVWPASITVCNKARHWG